MSRRSASLAPLQLELPALPASVAAARRGVARSCADRALDHDAVALAVSEAVSNVVVHAYRDRAPGPVRISAGMDDDSLIVVVSDDGSGMVPRTDSPGLGLGLPLMARLASAIEIDGDGAGTRVTMRFEGDG